MSDPSYEIQEAIVAAVKADTALTSLIGGRIYDPVPPTAAFPYISIGEDQVLPDLAQCYDGADVISTLHVWSRKIGYGEVKRVAAALESALTNATFALTGFRLVDKLFESTRYMRDPDGLTSHAVVTFRARTEPSD
jgi:hypothetical protein